MAQRTPSSLPLRAFLNGWEFLTLSVEALGPWWLWDWVLGEKAEEQKVPLPAAT